MEPDGGGASFFIRPGRRNVAGEMPFEAWMPLQPAPPTRMARKATQRMHFQFHFTGATIEVVKGLATKNSDRSWFILSSTIRAVVCCALLSVEGMSCAADTNAFAARREREFSQALARLEQLPGNSEALIAVAHTAFEWGEFAQNDDQRAAIAQRGIEAARGATNSAPTNAEAHYWLAMNLGQLARTKLLGALKLVLVMETQFLHALDLDDHIEYAGPDRCLGMLYRDAPGWPASIGNKKKARAHLERASTLHPDFPENQVVLLESYQEWSEKDDFERQFQTTEKKMSEARRRLTGPKWEQNWDDWDKRLAKMKSKRSELPKPAAGNDAK